jgi:hypothetical protein
MPSMLLWSILGKPHWYPFRDVAVVYQTAELTPQFLDKAQHLAAFHKPPEVAVALHNLSYEVTPTPTGTPWSRSLVPSWNRGATHQVGRGRLFAPRICPRLPGGLCFRNGRTPRGRLSAPTADLSVNSPPFPPPALLDNGRVCVWPHPQPIKTVASCLRYTPYLPHSLRGAAP